MARLEDAAGVGVSRSDALALTVQNADPLLATLASAGNNAFVLTVSDNARTIDLTQLVADSFSGALRQIKLTGSGNTLKLSPSAVNLIGFPNALSGMDEWGNVASAHPGAGALIVDGVTGNSNTVLIGAGWTLGSEVSVGGATYKRYTASVNGQNLVLLLSNLLTTSTTSGSTADTRGPVIDFNGLSSGLNADLGALGLSQFSSGVVRLPNNVTVLDDSTIRQVNVSITGIQDGDNETLSVVGSSTVTYKLNGNGIPASGSGSGVKVTVAGTTWSGTWGGSGVLSFAWDSSTVGNVVATSAQVQALLAAMRYGNSATTPSDGDRIFAFRATDAAGNGSASPGTVTLKIDATLPSLALTGGVKINDVSGGQFLVTFSEPVLASPLTSLSNWSVDNGSKTLGTGASVTAQDLVNGYASVFLVTGGTGRTYGMGSIFLLAASNVQDMSGNLAAGNIAIQLTRPSAVTAGSLTYSNNNGNTVVLSASNGAVTTYDSNNDGTLGEQFDLSFTSPIAVTRAITLANWTLSGSATLGSGASIVALNPVTVGGATYASSFRFTAGSGATYTTGTQLSIAASNVLDVNGNTASAGVSFSLPDIVAPAAPTPPAFISNDNYVNALEKTSPINMVFTHAAAASGDVLRVYVDGVQLATATPTAGASSTNVSLSGDQWGGGWHAQHHRSFARCRRQLECGHLAQTGDCRHPIAAWI